MAEWEDQHQNAENLRADQLLTKELRRLEIRRASGQDPPNQGAAKGGEESWIPPVKIDLVKEMFHDLERRRDGTPSSRQAELCSVRGYLAGHPGP